MLMKHW